MRFKVYGNYCGPGWSGGQYRKDNKYPVEAIDSWDVACMKHDAAIGQGESLWKADKEFLFSGFSNWNPMTPFPIIYHGIKGDFTPPSSPQKKELKTPPRNSTTTPYPTPLSMAKAKKRSASRKASPKRKKQRSNSLKKSRSAGKKAARSAFRARFGAGTTRHSTSFKKTKTKLKQFKGVSYIYETGATISETPNVGQPISQAVYLGHSTANESKRQLLYWTIAVKQLLKKGGYQVNDMKAPYNGVYIHIVYEGTNVVGQVTFDTSAGLTMETMSSALRDQFDTATTVVKTFKIMELRSTADGATALALASLNLETMLVKYRVESELKFQNITKSASGSSVTDIVSVNPVHCRKYFINQGYVANGVISRQDTSKLTNDAQLGFADDNGIIGFYNQALGSNEQGFYRNLPGKHSFAQCRKLSETYIKPGALVKDKLYYSHTTYFNTIFEQPDSTTADTAGNVSTYGRCHLLGFEKLIDNRAETSAIEFNYEIVQKFQADGWIKTKKFTAPLVTSVTNNYL